MATLEDGGGCSCDVATVAGSWWSSIILVHPCCVSQAGHHCCHGGGNNTYNTNVSYEETKLKEFEKKKKLTYSPRDDISWTVFFAHCLSSLPIVCPHCPSLSSPTLKT